MVSNTNKTAPFSSQDQQGVWEARPSRDPTMQNATTMQQVVPAEPDEWHSGEKTALFVHFDIKMIILPRQARDKHRKNSKKSAVFFQVRKRNRSLRGLLCGLMIVKISAVHPDKFRTSKPMWKRMNGSFASFELS
jgi:hypothetical protein